MAYELRELTEVDAVMNEELWALLAAVILGIVHLSVDSFTYKAQAGNKLHDWTARRADRTQGRHGPGPPGREELHGELCTLRRRRVLALGNR